MKKFLFGMFAAAGLLATSCSSDELVENGALNGNEVNATFTIETPEGINSRAIGDGGEVNWVACAVYDAAGKEIKGLRQNVEIKDKKATFETRLVKGQAYRVAFFAYCGVEGAPVHYNIEKLDSIYVTDWTGNKESRDAFTNKVDIAAEDADMVISKTVKLYRPFAQLNIGSTEADADAAEAADIVLREVEVTVTNVYTAFNAYADEVAGEPAEKVTYKLNGVLTPDVLTVGNVNYVYHSMNYMLVGNGEGITDESGEGKSLTDVTFKWVAKNEKTNEPVTTFKNIPVQRNYRTNIIGSILTNPAEFNIVIDAEFDGDINVDVPGASGDLMAAALEGGDHTLKENVSLYEYKNNPYLEIQKDFNLTIEDDVTLTTGDAGNYGIMVIGGTTEIEGGNIESQGGGIGVANGASLVFNSGNLNVNSTSTSGRYLFFLDGEGSTATINGGNFDFDRTKNQKRAYIYAGKGTTVYVKGGIFGKASTRSGYEKGIYGTGTVIITGGTFGFDPTEWVAEGCNIVKDGENWVVTEDLTAVRFVDLGLSVLWADRNVKATSETEVGQFYSWADTTDPVQEPDGDYSWNWWNYQYWTDANGDGIFSNDELLKYYSGDDLRRIVADDDIATKEYGTGCYIPTMEQINELRNNCQWTWDEANKGCWIEGSNGNKIFLPAGGYRNFTKLDNTPGVYCCIWSSDIDQTDLGKAQYLESKMNGKEVTSYLRHLGMPIRAVKNKN